MANAPKPVRKAMKAVNKTGNKNAVTPTAKNKAAYFTAAKKLDKVADKSKALQAGKKLGVKKK